MGVAHEQLQHLELLVGQAQAARGGGELKGSPVQGDVAHRQAGGGLVGLLPGHGPDAGQQLLAGEGFGQVVIGPAVQAQHLVLHLRLGRQQQHRQAVSPLAELAQHVNAVHLGHHDVQDGPVVVAGVEIIQGLLAVVDRVHLVVILPQQHRHRPGKRLFVLCQ